MKKIGKKINHLLELVLHLAAYTLVFILITNLFKSVYIDTNHTIIYSVLVVVILSILNNTIKPILVTLTIPITGITLGLFYPFINLLLLKIVDWLLQSHFELNDFWIALLVAVLLSVSNMIIDHIVVNPIIKGVIKSE